MRSGPGAARTILLFHIIVLGPLNSLVWYVPSFRYTRGLGWRIHCGVEVTKSSTNKQNIITNARTLEFLSMQQHKVAVFASGMHARLGAASGVLWLNEQALVGRGQGW